MKILKESVLGPARRLALCKPYRFESMKNQYLDLCHIWSRVNLLIKAEKEKERIGFQSRIKNLKMLRRVVLEQELSRPFIRNH